MGQNRRHRKALEKIAANPEKFGFKGVVLTLIEEKLFYRDRNIVEPDLIFETKKEEVHIIEYKKNGNERLMTKARRQLNRAKWWYEKYTDIYSENIKTHIITGDDPRYKNLFE